MTKINIYAVLDGVPRIWLTIEVSKDKAQEEGSRCAALTMTDKRVSDVWWDFAE
jgi:hypothetical protein